MLEETQAVLHETLERLDHAVSARDNYHIRLKDAHQQVLDLSAAHNRLSSLYHKRSEELDATAEEVVRLRHAVVHGLGAIAACPSCGAERTNGEQHDDDCPLLPYLREQEDRRAAAST
jgi:DNA repair exonuclease SbcCD ATPase subunit